MTQVETAIGSADIMRMMGWSRAKFFRHVPKMRTLGVVFYKREGQPPRIKIKAFPSRVIKYASLCGTRETPV